MLAFQWVQLLFSIHVVRGSAFVSAAQKVGKRKNTDRRLDIPGITDGMMQSQHDRYFTPFPRVFLTPYTTLFIRSFTSFHTCVQKT